MSKAVSGSGLVYTEYPIFKKTTTSVLESGEHISINPHNNAVDKAHIFLKGDFPSDQYYIRCTNPTHVVPDQFTVDSDGVVICYELRCENVISGTTDDLIVSLDNVSTQVDDNEDEIDILGEIVYGASATTEVDNSIVQRDNTVGTEIDKIICNTLASTGTAPKISMYGDGHLRYYPEIEVGGELVVKPDALYRFGANQEELGDFSTAGDGLEMKDEENEVLIQVQKTAPTVRIVGKKNAGVNYLECIDENDVVKFSVSNDEIVADKVVCDTIEARTGSSLKEIQVDTIKAKKSSLWLGDKLHISEENTRAQFQYRKDTIPVYLQGLSVDAADVVALGKTVATCTLSDWQQLSENAGGARELSMIFPQANVEADFEIKTTLNELLVTPHKDSENSGISISQPTSSHPCLFLDGNDVNPGGGHGLIQFANQTDAKALIYHSTADNDLHVENLVGDVQIDAPVVQLTGTLEVAADKEIRHGGVDIVGRITTLENAGGGGAVTTRFDFEANNTTYPQLDASIIDVVWTRQGGTSDGGAMSYELPATADIDNGHTIHVHCFQKHQSASNGGTVFFKRKSDQSFVSASFDHPQIYYYQSNTCYIANVDRSSFALHFHKDTNIANWYIRCTSDTNLLHKNEDNIAANTDSLAKQHYFKFFPNDEANYTVASGNHFTLPSGYRQITVFYGDSQENVKDDVHGVYINFPLTAADGDFIQLVNLHNFNSLQIQLTAWSSTGVQQVIKVRDASLSMILDKYMKLGAATNPVWWKRTVLVTTWAGRRVISTMWRQQIHGCRD